VRNVSSKTVSMSGFQNGWFEVGTVDWELRQRGVREVGSLLTLPIYMYSHAPRVKLAESGDTRYEA